MRYRFYHNVAENSVVCVSSYAGKKVRGIAKCAPGDIFDYERGCEIAQAKVDFKIAKKRMKRATKLYQEAVEKSREAAIKELDMSDYFGNSLKELMNCWSDMARLGLKID